MAEVVEAVAEETSEAEEEEAAEAGISGAAGEGAAGVTSGEEEVAAGAVGAGASAGHRKMLAFATFRAFTSECCAVLVRWIFCQRQNKHVGALSFSCPASLCDHLVCPLLYIRAAFVCFECLNAVSLGDCSSSTCCARLRLRLVHPARVCTDSSSTSVILRHLDIDIHHSSFFSSLPTTQLHRHNWLFSTALVVLSLFLAAC